MDFLNPKKKRAHRIRLLVGYCLVGVAIAAGTLILVLQAYGYDINRQSGEVIQNGLVFVDSHPVSSDVFVDDKLKGQTSQRLILPAGPHHLKLQRKNYRVWQRNFNLEGSGVERFVYPFLFPNDLKPKDIQLYSAQPTLATTSPNRQWLVVQQPGKLDSFDVVDLGNVANPTTTATLPAGLLTAKEGAHSLELVEWSSNNRHLLLKHSFADGYEYIVLDRQTPAASLNLNRLFNVPITKARLRDKKPDQFYLLDAASGTLRSAVADEPSPAAVLEKVIDFHPDGANQLLYVTKDGAAVGNVLFRLRSGSTTVNLRQLPKSGGYLLDMAKFDDQWYITFGTNTDKKLYIYKNPQSFNPRNTRNTLPPAYRALRLDVDPQFVSFSANARFVALQGGSQFAVYDLDNNRQYRYDSELKLPAGYQVRWMDGDRFAAVSEGWVVVFDYDNQNRHALLPGAPGLQPFFDRDYETMYVIGPSATVPGRTALTRSDLTQ